MDSILALLAALAATVFAFDLWLGYRRRPRPHIAAYGVGMTMFALATWAFYVGLTYGWTGPVYRAFYLFGAILNIPYLALGSMFLVVGRRSGHVMTIILGAFTAISTTLTATVPFANPLPESGVPHDIFASGFGPRLFAIIGGAAGSTILIALALVSIFRFWKSNRKNRLGQPADRGRHIRRRLRRHRPRPGREQRIRGVTSGRGDPDLGRLPGGLGCPGGTGTRCCGDRRGGSPVTLDR